MKYKIKNIRSKERKSEKLLLIAEIFLLLLCLSFSIYYQDRALPDFLYQSYKETSAFAEVSFIYVYSETVSCV